MNSETILTDVILLQPKQSQYSHFVFADTAPVRDSFLEGSAKFCLAADPETGPAGDGPRWAVDGPGLHARWSASPDAADSKPEELRGRHLPEQQKELLEQYPEMRSVLAGAVGHTVAGLVGELEAATGLQCYMQRGWGMPWKRAAGIVPGRRPKALDVDF